MSVLVEVHESAGALAAAAAGELLTRLADLQAAGGHPTVGLTGGTIADATHREVARLASGFEVDWARVSFWFSDERFVAADSPDRNAVQARTAFLDAVGATEVHEVASTGEAGNVDEAAVLYGDAVRSHGAGGFDILMLGIGPDGHVASLFPGHDALDATDAIAVGVHDSPKPPPERVSLTFEAMQRSESVWFLASGHGKADAVSRSLAEEGTVAETPARGVVGASETLWWLDREAASLL